MPEERSPILEIMVFGSLAYFAVFGGMWVFTSFLDRGRIIERYPLLPENEILAMSMAENLPAVIIAFIILGFLPVLCLAIIYIRNR